MSVNGSTIVVADTPSHPEEGSTLGGGRSATDNNTSVADTTAAAITATMTTGPTLRNRRIPGGRRGGRSSLTKDEDGRSIDQVAQVRPANEDASSGTGRQKRMLRRRERNKWKPYHQLSWEEKKKLEEKETKRAELRRNQPTTLGFPMAPYNTSQFLMADHKSDHQVVVEDMEGGSSEESSLADMEGVDNVALDRGYAEEWAKVLSVNLENFSKQRLISHVLEVEEEKADLERRLRMLEKGEGGGATSSNTSSNSNDQGRMTTFQDGDVQLVDGVK